jgi:hypothetical protein
MEPKSGCASDTTDFALCRRAKVLNSRRNGKNLEGFEALYEAKIVRI